MLVRLVEEVRAAIGSGQLAQRIATLREQWALAPLP
jgi:hypothetical protein